MNRGDQMRLGNIQSLPISIEKCTKMASCYVLRSEGQGSRISRILFLDAIHRSETV